MVEQDVNGEEEAVTFRLTLGAGKTFLVNDFVEDDQTYGVYYTYITYLGSK